MLRWRNELLRTWFDLHPTEQVTQHIITIKNETNQAINKNYSIFHN